MRLQTTGQISYKAFARQVNTLFQVHPSSGQVVKLKLLKAPPSRPTPCAPGRRPAADAGNEKFSLIFSGPKAMVLAPAIHRFTHDDLGQFDMYIGQIGAEYMDQFRYQSVFNRPPADGGECIT